MRSHNVVLIFLFTAALFAIPQTCFSLPDMEGRDIEELQARLLVEGVYHENITGKKDEETYKAAESYLSLRGHNAKGDTGLKIALDILRSDQAVDRLAEGKLLAIKVAELEKKLNELPHEVLADIYLKVILWVIASIAMIIGGALWFLKKIELRSIQIIAKHMRLAKQKLNQHTSSKIVEIEKQNKSYAKLKVQRAHVKSFHFMAIYLWDMNKRLKERTSDTVYKKSLEYQLFAAKVAETYLAELSEEQDDARLKLEVLSSCAFFYVDQDVFVKYQDEARQLRLSIIELREQIPKDWSRHIEVEESLIYVGYKLKIDPIAETLSRLNVLLRTAGAKWAENLEGRYKDIGFPPPAP